MTSDLTYYIKKTSYFLTVYFPLVFSFAACLGYGADIGIIISCSTILLMSETDHKKLMPFIISFLIIGRNQEYSIPASLICGTLLIVSSFFYDKIKKLFSSVFVPGIKLGGALTATVLFTTTYFGIGATGENVTEMIKSYVSLGFHPNWRGVLYGTIVLVLMITIPRKFKTISRYFSASFVAIIFTLILNLFLNPADMITAINEISNADSLSINEFTTLKAQLDLNFYSVINGIALYLICMYSFLTDETLNKKDVLITSVLNTITCGIFSLPIPYAFKNYKKSIVPRILAIIILLISFALFKDIVLRIPIHSCAVVIIVTAWENVKWKEIGKSFKGLVKFILFITSFAICLLTDISVGILYIFFVSLFLTIINKSDYITKPVA